MLLFVKNKFGWIAILIPLSIGFKETTIILCAAFLFAQGPWKKRWTMLAGSLGFAIIVKLCIDYFVHAPMFFTMETRVNGDSLNGLYFFENLNNLKSIFPFFINGGTLLVFFLLPGSHRTITYLKILAIPFVIGNFAVSYTHLTLPTKRIV